MKFFASRRLASSDTPRLSARLAAHAEALGVWLLGRGAPIWPFLVAAIVLSLSWSALRQIRPRDFRAVLHSLDSAWLVVAAVAAVANVAVMGLYDVVVFRHTRARWSERWRFGAVAFAWSNFLTLGPLAGPAIRLWLYQPRVDQLSELHDGVLSMSVAFTAGLVGWTAAAVLATRIGLNTVALCAIAFPLVLLSVWSGRAVTSRMTRFAPSVERRHVPSLQLACVGWLDWFLAAVAFVACTRASGDVLALSDVGHPFFVGQALGVISLMPGGFGASDMFWIVHLGLGPSTAAAVLTAYRSLYYVIPWATASLVLLTWVTTRAPARSHVVRRVTAGLVGGGGVLMILSSASPAVHARLALLSQLVPLPLVEMGEVTAALAGLLLLVLARGLARGYRTAFRATLALLALAALAAVLKGLDWEESLVLAAIAAMISSQAALFDRPSRGDWFEERDLGVAFGALALFILFGTISHRISPLMLERWATHVGYRFQGTRFIRTAISMSFAVVAATLYVLMRTPVGFRRPSEEEMARARAMLARLGGGTNPLMVATGDKAIFFDGQRGFCLYRTIGPYLIVFADPVVCATAERRAFLDALFAFCTELDRRPVFYQLSTDWIPVLHDRGYDFFKLGEEAHVALEALSLEGHAGKLSRQILRRAERDAIRFRILTPDQIPAHLAELKHISDDWLTTKGMVERQFSIGFFDAEYLCRYPCAVVEEARPNGRILGFANLLEGPAHQELSVDLMRYRSGGPSVMDFLMVSLLFHGKAAGYAVFNLGVAPLASVGEHRGAHLRERLARLLFQRGEQWYNFQGLRYYKQKFGPQWVPRYVAYQHGWEWPMAIAYVNALTAGGWRSIVLPAALKPASREPSGQAAEA